MKILILLILILLNGCSTLRTANGKFYVGQDDSVLITNDRSCNDKKSCIILRGRKIEYKIIMDF